MSDVALEGFGGGGTSLNFKVLAYATEELLMAATPKENTIGIITDTPVTGCYFQAKQPENMAEGEVWISTGTSSQVAFNALKKGTVMVYPLNAKQMQGGTLVDVTAKSYQGGQWVEWVTFLYNEGGDYSEVWNIEDALYSDMTISFGRYMEVNVPNPNGGYGRNFACYHDLYDLSEFNGMEVSFKSTNAVSLGISRAIINGYNHSEWITKIDAPASDDFNKYTVNFTGVGNAYPIFFYSVGVAGPGIVIQIEYIKLLKP